jgi:hypothetical protein
MQLFFALLGGILISFVFPNLELQSVPGYEHLLYALLAIGLYGAVAGINIQEFHVHKSLIFRAVTFGVLLKSVIIGSILWFIFQTPYAFLFGVIVAQIDPLSVAHLLENKSSAFSASGRTILRAWSSFDDPMTVLLALYVFLPIVIGQNFSLDAYFGQLLANLFFAGILSMLAKPLHRNGTKLILLSACMIIAIPFKLMLGIALVGLFLRPTITSLERIVHICFLIAATILGTLVTFEISSLLTGIVLGVAAYAAQYLVTYIVAPKLHGSDKQFLALAQFNGITSIILALIIAQFVLQTISVIAAAVVTINLLYYLCNYIVEKKQH